MPAAFGLLIVGSLIYDAAHAAFWSRAHNTAPFAGIVILILLALLLRRHRFAWWVFVVVSALGFVTWMTHALSHGAGTGWIVGGLLGVVQFGLLVSPPMRRFMRLRGRLAPNPS